MSSLAKEAAAAQSERARALLAEQSARLHTRTDQMFGILMLAQWAAGIIVALIVSPRAWAGTASSVHPHVQAAVYLGAMIASLPVWMAWRHPGHVATRQCIAVGQMLFSALFIHLSGGRIETHFHVFGSLAFLAFYRDWRVLASATVVVASDHFVRGLLWPQSVYGILTVDSWRTVEHAAWVIFEDVFLMLAVRRSLAEMSRGAEREAQLESLNASVEQTVATRTRQLQESELATMNMMEDSVRNREKAEQALADLQREIAERKKVEAQFMQAQKMEAIGQLAGGIAHDFNNILGAIIGNTELARMQTEVTPATAACLDSIMKASQRAADLVRQILAFSRRHELERQPMQLQIIIREALKLLRATLPTTIVIKTNLGNAPTVLADPTQIHQVIMNLCTNASHAMRDRSGILKVELAEFEVDSDFVQTHPDLRPGRYVRLSVSDSGCGMDPATVEKIFEPFFTTKPQGEGTGLGLSVVHGIMKSHDGGITVYSQPGEGTAFHLYFPVFETDVPQVTGEAKAPPRGEGQHILLVDDEHELVELGRIVLQRLGYRVTTKTSPLDAIAAVRAQPDQFDMVITDLTMPGMNGTNLARVLLVIRPTLPIILTTGYSATITSETAHELGFRGLLPKPTDVQSLADGVHRVFNQATKG